MVYKKTVNGKIEQLGTYLISITNDDEDYLFAICIKSKTVYRYSIFDISHLSNHMLPIPIQLSKSKINAMAYFTLIESEYIAEFDSSSTRDLFQQGI
jgi:hypothetical protein